MEPALSPSTGMPRSPTTASVYRTNLFSLANLKSVDQIDYAIHEFEKSVSQEKLPKYLDRILVDEDQRILPLILACVFLCLFVQCLRH
jgi:hypothetical protein